MNTDRTHHRHADTADEPPVSDQIQLPWQYTVTPLLQCLRDGARLVHSAEINRVAGLDWGIYQTPAYFFVAAGAESQPVITRDGVVVNVAHDTLKLAGTRGPEAAAPAPNCFFNVRDDVHDVVGVVRRRYRVLQNADAPAFLDQLVDAGDGVFEAAAALHGGARVFWLMRLENLGAGSETERLDTYLLVENSHDGSKSYCLSTFAARPASQATLAWRLPSAPRALKLGRTASASERRLISKRALELGAAYARELAAIRDRMLQTSMSDERFRDFVGALIPTPKPIVARDRVTNQRGITMATNAKGVITQLYHYNERLETIRGTLWGVVQACEFYSNHLSIARTTDDASPDENRLKRLLTEATLGGKAFAQALEWL